MMIIYFLGISLFLLFSFGSWEYFSELKKEKGLFRKEFHAHWNKDKLKFKSDEGYDEQ